MEAGTWILRKTQNENCIFDVSAVNVCATIEGVERGAWARC